VQREGLGDTASAAQGAHEGRVGAQAAEVRREHLDPVLLKQHKHRKRSNDQSILNKSRGKKREKERNKYVL
jgi:hypothetical protein